jgi:hypothetical protein
MMMRSRRRAYSTPASSPDAQHGWLDVPASALRPYVWAALMVGLDFCLGIGSFHNSLNSARSSFFPIGADRKQLLEPLERLLEN